MSRFLALTLALAGPAFAEDTGSLCLHVVKWEFPKGASSPGDTPHPIKRFTVQIDDGEVHDVTERAWLVEGLALEGKHRVRVFADGRAKEGFHFTFEQGPALHLTHKGFYDSWMIGPSKKPCPLPVQKN